MYSTGNNRAAVYDGKIAGLYDLEETLGSGHFAVVKLARHVFTGEKVAVKVIDKNKLDEVSRAHLFQEVRCMKLVQHPHVVRLYEVIDTQTKLYLILELGDGGDLYDYIMKHEGGLSESLAREYFRQIVRAISYCHQLHVVHRDLKPENVLFFEKLGVVKLTDFGFSNKFCPGQKLQTSCGSLAYSAPEILLGDSYDAPAVDVWSLGVILYMLVCGHPPFQEANDSETLTMIMDCKYTMPAHVSPDCHDLISRMLVRQPEKRATLQQIAVDPWLSQDGPEFVPECLPLVSRQQVSEEDHNLIIQKMVNGNIAIKEDILEALDKNEYNHITATYFLLAERKLRSHRPEVAPKRRPELSLPVSNNLNSMNRNELPTQDSNHLLIPSSAGHLNALLTPGADGTASGRARKCSIVAEEDDDEDDADHDDLSSSLNRRGSRSEGRINLAIQDRIAESELLKLESTLKIGPAATGPVKCVLDGISGVKMVTSGENDVKDRLGKFRGPGIIRRPTDFRPRTAPDAPPKIIPTTLQLNSTNIKDTNVRSHSVDHSYDALNKCRENDSVSTKFLTDSSTISIPLPNQQTAAVTLVGPPKYKTMPSPTRANTILPGAGANCLNEIFEECTDIGSSDTSATTTPRPVARHTNFTNNRSSPHGSASGSAQRRTKFHKTRTASCSSSDDDDSENRKKRAHKIVDTHKSFQPQRRDSNDDSSDSQDQGSATAGSNSSSQNSIQIMSSTGEQSQGNSSQTNGTSNNTNSTQKCGQTVGYRRHRAGRRRNGETRLRESQSLNRITEVQELEAPQLLANQNQSSATSQRQHISSTVTAAATAPIAPTKSGKIARLFHGFRKTDTSTSHASDTTQVPFHLDDTCTINTNTKNSTSTTSINSTTTANDDLALGAEIAKAIKVTAESKSSAAAKKLKLLGKYFQIHKKICIPLPGIFQRGRLYKAQSCGSIVREKVNQIPIKGSTAVTPKARARHSLLFTGKSHAVANGIDPRLLRSDADTTY